MTDLAAIQSDVPTRFITQADVRASIGRARRSLEKAAEEIVWQIEMEAWRTLGYQSWTAMREAEYGGAAFMVPSKSRPEIVARIRAAGLTQREAADTAGVSERTIQREDTTGGSRGPAKNTTNVGFHDDDVIDAEVVEDESDYITYADSGERVNTATGEVIPDKATDPAPAEPVIATTCPTCHGTGKVTR